MRPSPLQLNDYWVDNLTFSTNYDHEPDEPVVRVISPEDLLVEVQESVNPENSLQRSCNISIALNESAAANFPWMFNVSLVGYFQIDEDWPGNKDSLFSANAPAVLYSAAREALAAVSGRGPYREVLLPSVTFINLPPPEKQLPAAAEVQQGEGTKSPAKAARKTARKQGKG
jgi:preprotein translocase subunit SecB